MFGDSTNQVEAEAKTAPAQAQPQAAAGKKPPRQPQQRFHHVTMAPAIDVAILAHLFHAFDATVKSLDSAGVGDGVLPTDRELAGRALELLQRLPNQGEPVVSARTGRIQEFLADYDDPDPGHRHWSGLWSIYPGTRSSPTFMEPGTSGAKSLLQVRSPPLSLTDSMLICHALLMRNTVQTTPRDANNRP